MLQEVSVVSHQFYECPCKNVYVYISRKMMKLKKEPLYILYIDGYSLD